MNRSTRHLVDPELLDYLEASPTQVFNADTLGSIRTELRLAFPPEVDPRAAAFHVSRHSAKGPKGAPDVPLLVVRPPDVSRAVGCIYHIHGGGYVCGDAAICEPVLRGIAAATDCVIVSADYRLAPETSFPGNVEDCYAGLAWVYQHAPELRIDVERIGVKGESAGGGLAAALALLARDRGELKLAFQHLTAPMIDDKTCISGNANSFVGEFIWNVASNRFGWESLLGCAPGSENISPYAAPARAVSLADLPPTFIATGALDLFVEENLQYARRLMREGVPVELHLYPRAFHGFDQHPTAKVARAAQRDSLAALTRFLTIR